MASAPQRAGVGAVKTGMNLLCTFVVSFVDKVYDEAYDKEPSQAVHKAGRTYLVRKLEDRVPSRP